MSGSLRVDTIFAHNFQFSLCSGSCSLLIKMNIFDMIESHHYLNLLQYALYDMRLNLNFPKRQARTESVPLSTTHDRCDESYGILTQVRSDDNAVDYSAYT